LIILQHSDSTRRGAFVRRQEQLVCTAPVHIKLFTRGPLRDGRRCLHLAEISRALVDLDYWLGWQAALIVLIRPSVIIIIREGKTHKRANCLARVAVTAGLLLGGAR